MRKVFLLLTALGVALSGSVLASGNPTWIPLAPGRMPGGVTARVLSETATETIREIDRRVVFLHRMFDLTVPGSAAVKGAEDGTIIPNATDGRPCDDFDRRCC